MTATFIEYVLTKAPVDRIFSDIRPCSGCAFRYDDDKCIEQTGCVSMGEIYVWSIVPAGFSDEEAGHGH